MACHLIGAKPLTDAGILLIGPLETTFNEILIIIYKFSFKTIRLKMLFVKWRPFCLSCNMLIKALYRLHLAN